MKTRERKSGSNGRHPMVGEGKGSAFRLRSLTTAIVALGVGAVSVHGQLTTYSFGGGANAFTMDFVTVGNPGNANDASAPNFTSHGAVPYIFEMGKYEVSESMITKAIAGGLTGVSMTFTRGADKPATTIGWFEAALFVNWLNTSTGRQAAYRFDGSGNFLLWDSADAWQTGGENLYRHKNAFFFLPSENEWYKSAYYNGVAGVYYDYPTGSDTAPTAVASGTTAGTAVYNGQAAPANITIAGGLSPYGTMGQGGNVLEWMESAFDGSNNSTTEDRPLRGGSFVNASSSLLSSSRTQFPPGVDAATVGFRVAVVPEPSQYGLALAGVALGFAVSLRRTRPGGQS